MCSVFIISGVADGEGQIQKLSGGEGGLIIKEIISVKIRSFILWMCGEKLLAGDKLGG